MCIKKCKKELALHFHFKYWELLVWKIVLILMCISHWSGILNDRSIVFAIDLCVKYWDEVYSWHHIDPIVLMEELMFNMAHYLINPLDSRRKTTHCSGKSTWLILLKIHVMFCLGWVRSIWAFLLIWNHVCTTDLKWVNILSCFIDISIRLEWTQINQKIVFAKLIHWMKLS